MGLENKIKVKVVILIAFLYLVLYPLYVFSGDEIVLDVNSSLLNDTNNTNLTADINNTILAFDSSLNEPNISSNNTLDVTPQLNDIQKGNNGNNNKDISQNTSIFDTGIKDNAKNPPETPVVDVPVSTQTYDVVVAINSNYFYYFISYGNKLLFKSDGLEDVNFYYSDVLGSIRGTFDGGANILSYKNYLLFGEQIGNNADYSGKAYTTKEQDDKSGFYFFGARYYNPLTASFVSVDQVYDSTKTPYAYAENNPLKFVDPDGRKVVFATNIYDNKKVRDIYRVAGQKIPKIRNIMIDSLSHEFSDKELNKDYRNLFDELEKRSRKFMDATTVSGTLSLFDMSKIKSYGDKSDMLLLNSLLHESIHQSDISEAEAKGIKYPKTTTPEQELELQSSIGAFLGLDKSYEDQIKNENSWVSTSKISKEDYGSLVEINTKMVNWYKHKIIKEQYNLQGGKTK